MAINYGGTDWTKEYKKARHRLQERIRYWTKKGMTFDRKGFVPPANPKNIPYGNLSNLINYMKGLTKEELKKRARDTTQEQDYRVLDQEELFSYVITMFRTEIEQFADRPFIYMAEDWLDGVITKYGTRLASYRLESYASEIILAIDGIGYASDRDEADYHLSILKHTVSIAMYHDLTREEADDNGNDPFGEEWVY